MKIKKAAKNHTAKTLSKAIRDSYVFDLFGQDLAGSALDLAQRNLGGRTHWADTDTLRFFNARVVRCKVLDCGLILGVTNTQTAGFSGPRVFRSIFFDIDGQAIYETPFNIDDTSTWVRSGTKAEKQFWEAANSIDAVEVTLDLLSRKKARMQEDIKRLSDITG